MIQTRSTSILVFLFFAFSLSACMQEGDFNEKEVQYAGLKILIPDQLKEGGTDYTFISEDKTFTANVLVNESGFQQYKDSFIEEKLFPITINNILREENIGEEFSQLLLIEKYKTDGMISIIFGIETKDLKKRDKLIRASKKSLKSISVSHDNINLSDDLPYSLSAIPDIEIAMRMNKTINIKKTEGSESVSISYLFKSFELPTDFPISGRGYLCEEAIIEEEQTHSVSGISSLSVVLSQKCESGSVKLIRTVVDMPNNKKIWVVMLLPIDPDANSNIESNDFYNEVLDKIVIK